MFSKVSKLNVVWKGHIFQEKSLIFFHPPCTIATIDVKNKVDFFKLCALFRKHQREKIQTLVSTALCRL